MLWGQTSAKNNTSLDETLSQNSFLAKSKRAIRQAALITTALAAFASCGDKGGGGGPTEPDPSPSMTVTAQAPSSVEVGSPYSVELSGQKAEGAVDVQYTLSRPGVPDTTIQETVASNLGRATIAKILLADIAGEHTAAYNVKDSDGGTSDDRSGALNIKVNPAQQDSTMSAQMQLPASTSALEGVTAYINGEAADQNPNWQYTITGPQTDSTFSRTLQAPTGVFTDSIHVSPRAPRNYTIRAVGEDSDDTVTLEQTIQFTQPGAMTLSVNAPSSVQIGEPYEERIVEGFWWIDIRNLLLKFY